MKLWHRSRFWVDFVGRFFFFFLAEMSHIARPWFRAFSFKESRVSIRSLWCRVCLALPIADRPTCAYSIIFGYVNIVTTNHIGPLKCEVKLMRIKMKNQLLNSSSHITCSTVTCDQWLFCWTVQYRSFSSLQKIPLDSSALELHFCHLDKSIWYVRSFQHLKWKI